VADRGDWDSYFWPGTQVLRNLPGVRDQDRLNASESMAAKSRMFELAREPLDGGFDLDHMKRIHKQLFQDVYAWAGELRTAPPFPTAMIKGGPSPDSIAAGEYTADDWFRAKFNAGRFLIQHNTDTSLLAETLAQVIDRRMTGQPRRPAGSLPAYEPHYISDE
jgi:fido (protein-threonine AMPylation protein)